MKVLISGSSGLVGRPLVRHLRARGDSVHRLVRRAESAPDAVRWSPADGSLPVGALDGVDCVVNLAGENIAGRRWTDAHKARVLNSRVSSTQILSEAIAASDRRPSFVSASAIGYYGDRGQAWMSEQQGPGDLFLSEVCVAWEAAARRASDAGARVVHPRIGVVLSKNGGALKAMLPAFRLGAGGVVGDGKQYMSWITLHDLIRLLTFLIDHNIEGPVNAVSPAPVTNQSFTKALGRALNRPTVVPLPAFAVKALLGQMGRELLLASTRASSQKIQTAGFAFDHDGLERGIMSALDPEPEALAHA
ncbi:MAG: TIGR01777 family oxidoreductase [Myxococcota bacterium]